MQWLKSLLGSTLVGIFVAGLVIYFYPELLNNGPVINVHEVNIGTEHNTSSHHSIDSGKKPSRAGGHIDPTPITFSGGATGPVSYADAVAMAAPAVVNIYTSKLVARRSHPLFDNPTFRRRFGLDHMPKRQRMESSLGSGVIVSPQGYVLTNNHVVAEADEIRVALKDGRETLAQVVGTDPETDLAVLKIEMDNIPAVTLAQSEAVRVGDVVLAIGNPFGLGQTVTMGIVSAKGRTGLQLSTFEDFIQTDAAINRGNSGGALVNAMGNLIGISTAIFSESGGSQGIGFAIPSRIAKEVMLQIIQHGQVVRGWLGIVPKLLDANIAATYGLPNVRGIVIADLFKNGPAHLGGLQPGDIITHINDQAIINERESMNFISSMAPGETVKIAIIRDGQAGELKIDIGERPKER
ncbi:MAG: trypsin-like peptidase domain-containing protein [Pseudomonadales bacterium]|nr:trypsin-like peptidase domain-containing protein [Pseudomonadales bacterium]